MSVMPALAAVAGLLLLPALAPAEPADSPILIRSLSPGTEADAAAEHAILQMTVDGQDDVDGARLDFYGPDGSPSGSFDLEGGSLVGDAQRTILLATPEAAAQSGFPAPDFSLDTGDALEPSAGALCLTGPYPADCASWGNFPSASALALPDPQTDNADRIRGKALGRSIGHGCASWLDPDDDNRPSSAHFFDGVPHPEAEIPQAEPAPLAPHDNAAG